MKAAIEKIANSVEAKGERNEKLIVFTNRRRTFIKLACTKGDVLPVVKRVCKVYPKMGMTSKVVISCVNARTVADQILSMFKDVDGRTKEIAVTLNEFKAEVESV